MDKVYDYIDRNKWIEWILFLGVFWLFIVNLHLNRGLDDMIPGYHYWRKTDTYAQIMNYYHNGLNFFDHGIYYNQMKSQGQAVAEFPLYYYFVAVQLKFFGQHDIILKINWLVTLFFGMWSIFKISLYFTKNHLLSIAVPLTLFLSPVFAIYCIEYLPDPIALNLSFIGLYFLLKYDTRQTKKSLILGLLFISISGMMKPFYLIPFIALVIIIIGGKLLKKEAILKYWFYSIPFILVGLWFLYVEWYNSSVNSAYFLSSTKSVWALKPEILVKTNEKIMTKWWPAYFHPIYFLVFIGMAFTALTLYFRSNLKQISFYIFCLLGSAVFIILFYGMLKDHDYYIFPILFLIPLTAGLTAYNISKIKWPSIVNTSIGFLVLVFMYSNVTYSWEIRQSRLKYKPVNATHLFVKYKGLDHFLLDNGIGPDDLVIAFSDKSPSYALLLLNRKGWSGYQTFSRRLHVNDLIDRGAKYIVIDNEILQKRDSVALEGVEMTYLADTNQIYLYKLDQ